MVAAGVLQAFDFPSANLIVFHRNQIKVIRRTFQQLKTEARHGADQELIVCVDLFLFSETTKVSH